MYYIKYSKIQHFFGVSTPFFTTTGECRKPQDLWWVCTYRSEASREALQEALSTLGYMGVGVIQGDALRGFLQPRIASVLRPVRW